MTRRNHVEKANYLFKASEHGLYFDTFLWCLCYSKAWVWKWVVLKMHGTPTKLHMLFANQISSLGLHISLTAHRLNPASFRLQLGLVLSFIPRLHHSRVRNPQTSTFWHNSLSKAQFQVFFFLSVKKPTCFIWDLGWKNTLLILNYICQKKHRNTIHSIRFLP